MLKRQLENLRAHAVVRPKTEPEPEPQTVELRAPEAPLLHHVYGNNGLMLELEVGWRLSCV